MICLPIGTIGFMKWNIAKYFTAEYWTTEFKGASFLHRVLLKPARIAVAAGYGYSDDDCSAKASALTYYSLLSIVPVLAVAFGIAKGFGFEKHLEYEINQRFFEQKELVEKLISFAYTTLQNAQSGLIAGIGLIALFWTVLKLLGNIESSFNAIWKVTKPRALARRFSDYLSMMLFCPIFFAASSSLSIFIVTQIVNYSRSKGVWETVSPFVMLAFHIFPMILAWILFTAIYYIMPNTRVPFSCAAIAGVVAGTIYQIVQAIYINFQVGLTSYGAIYGSFAALPLFLIWLNLSWIITLAGAEIAYHIENDMFQGVLHRSLRKRKVNARIVGLLIMRQCLDAFRKGNPPPLIHQLAERIGVPVVVIHRLVRQLVNASLLVDVNWKGGGGGHYQPARDVKTITYKSVCDALDSSRENDYVVAHDSEVEEIEKTLAAFDALIESAPENRPVDLIN